MASRPPIAAITDSWDFSWASASARRSGVEVADEVQHLHAHGGHRHAGRRGRLLQLGQPGREPALARPAQLDRVEAEPLRRAPTSSIIVSPGRYCSCTASRTGCLMRASGRKSRITCSRSAGGWSSSAYASAACSAGMHVGDQRQRVQPAAGAQLHHGRVQPLAGPAAAAARSARRRSGTAPGGPGCGGTPRRAAAPRRALVEAGGDHGAVDPGAADRLVQRRVGPGQLDHPVGAAAVGLLPHASARRRRRPAPGSRRTLGASSSRAGMASTAITSMPWPASSWVASRPITPWPNTATVSPRRRAGGQHGVQGDRADPVEGADHRVEAGRQPVPASRSAGSTASRRWPHMPQTRSPTREAGHVAARPPRPARPRSSPRRPPGRRRSSRRRGTGPAPGPSAGPGRGWCPGRWPARCRPRCRSTRCGPAPLRVRGRGRCTRGYRPSAARSARTRYAIAADAALLGAGVSHRQPPR